MASAAKRYLAVDLGASSGRLVAGSFDGDALQLEEVHRFANGGVRVNERLHWDVLALWSSVQDGMRQAANQYGDSVVSIGVDTWGVDFALLAKDQLLGNPFHYRDSHTNDVMEKAFEVAPAEEIFEHTGLQFMQFNSLFQLYAMKLAGSPLLSAADRFLMIPDLFHWLLTGVQANEYTNATTSQLYNSREKRWATELIEKLGLPSHIFGDVRLPGESLGALRASLAEAVGLPSHVEVVLPGTHDTASAVMAAPTSSPFGAAPDWCYISSGTWSLMGAETPGPVINADCLERNFTNEGGVGGTVRLLKNIAGLWLLQECRRIWGNEGSDYEWDSLVDLAETTPPLRSFIAPDDARFIAPANMPQAIVDYCRESGQTAPDSHGAVIRTALESLALRYRRVLQWTEELTGGELKTIHVVGGGAQNQLLCQMTADACNRVVVAGPSEATAIGNVMMQCVAKGDVDSIAQAREVIRRSFEVARYEPQNPGPWDEAFERFVALES